MFKQVAAECDLSFYNHLAMSFDGAAAMFGRANSVAKQLKDEIGTIINVHCMYTDLPWLIRTQLKPSRRCVTRVACWFIHEKFSFVLLYANLNFREKIRIQRPSHGGRGVPANDSKPGLFLLLQLIHLLQVRPHHFYIDSLARARLLSVKESLAIA